MRRAKAEMDVILLLAFPAGVPPEQAATTALRVVAILNALRAR
jgi:hypothetical protein